MSRAPAKQEAPAKGAKTAAVNAAKPATAKPAKAAKSATAKPVSNAAPRPKHTEGRLSQVLVAPIVSEKATLVSEKQNQVTFKVLRDATKPEIKAAVELLFKVQVERVQVVNTMGKTKRFGRFTGRRDHAKKAYVSLKPGQEINFAVEV